MKQNLLILLFILFSTTFANQPTSDKLNKPYAMEHGKPYAVDLTKLQDSIVIHPTKVETGRMIDFSLGIPSRTYIPGFFSNDSLYADVEWSIEPKSKNLILNKKTGQLQVSRRAEHNGEYTVEAKIKGLTQPIKSKLLIFSKIANPLIGSWREQATGDDTINGLSFTADGQFSVTVTPFESYKDYYGTYTIDPENRILSLTIKGGNKKPEDINIDKISYYFTKEGHIVLKNCYFGTIRDGFKKKSEYRFAP